MTVATLNVSVDQIRSDLRGGKTVDQIAAEWSEPVANVRAVLMQMQRERSGAPTALERPLRPLQPVVANATTVPALDLETARLIDLVTEASRSSSSQTRKLGARLDAVAETVAGRLRDERATAAERAAKERQRAEALAEIQRLEDQLRQARERAGLRGAGVARGNTAPRTSTQIDAMAQVRAAARGEFPCAKGCGKVSTTKAGQLSHERHCAGAA